MSHPLGQPEFARHTDVTRLFGLKRGTLYNLYKRKKIKSCLLRVEGKRSGVRLFHLESIRKYIQGSMVKQQEGSQRSKR